jgi:transposase
MHSSTSTSTNQIIDLIIDLLDLIQGMIAKLSSKTCNFIQVINSENKIKDLVLPYLSVGKRGKKSTLCLIKIFLLILKRLKTGTQWRELSTRDFFEETVPWQTIYYYFNKWSKDGSFLKVWQQLLMSNKHLLDLSSTQFDGTHTPCKRGGESVGYQGRKSCKTSNSLILCDNNGLPLVVGKPYLVIIMTYIISIKYLMR